MTNDPSSTTPIELDEILPELYDTLRQLAASQLRSEARHHSLQPTDLAHEAFLRLSRQTHMPWRVRSTVLSAAAQTIRRILVDHARARKSQKRGGGYVRVPLEGLGGAPGGEIDILNLHEQLKALALRDARQARIVELRFFGGLAGDEVASVLGVSPRTVDNDWRVARAWLKQRLMP